MTIQQTISYAALLVYLAAMKWLGLAPWQNAERRPLWVAGALLVLLLSVFGRELLSWMRQARRR